MKRLLVSSPGAPLESFSNTGPRQMIIKYRTRLIGLLANEGLIISVFFCVILSFFGHCFVILKNEHSGMIIINKSEKVGTT